jgi:DNA-binding transcriptional LysR family regulator
MMIRQSRVMLNEVANTEEELDAIAGGAKSLLKVGTLPLTGIVSVLNSVIRLQTEMPGVLVNISEGTVSDLVSELDQGKIDCFVGEVLTTHDLHKLSFERLYEDRIYVVASPEHRLLRKKRRFAWRELQYQKWALPPKGGILRQAFMEAFIREGLTPPSGEVECQSSITVGALCQLDETILGILRSEAALHQEALGLLKIVPMRSAAALPPLSVVTRKGYAPVPLALTAFIDCLKQAAAVFRSRIRK